MKKILFLSILFFGLVSCEKIDSSTQFSIDYTTSFQTPAVMTTNTSVDLGTYSLTSNKNIFNEYQTSRDLIENANLKSVTLTINNTNQNFNFVRNLEIYLEANDLPTLRLAWINNLKDLSENTLQLKHLSVDLSEYFKKDKIYIKIISINDNTLSQPVDIDVKLSVYINAELIKK